jgi:hypothetical protein
MKYMRGKTVPIVLLGGGTLIDPVSALWELYAGDPVPEAVEHVTPLIRLRGRGTTGGSRHRQGRLRRIEQVEAYKRSGLRGGRVGLIVPRRGPPLGRSLDHPDA